MNQTLKTILNKVSKFVSDNNSEIFAGLGIGLFIGTGALAVAKAPKTKQQLDICADNKEKAKVIAKNYWPVVIGTAGATACIIESVSTNNKKVAMLSAAYTMAQDAFTEYRGKVIETIGETKEKKVRESIAKQRVAENPPTASGIINPTSNLGPSLFYEPISRIYFYGDINEVKKRCIELSNMELVNNCVSLVEFLSELGIAGKLSDYDYNSYMQLGWNITDDAKAVTVDLHPITADSLDGRACNCIDYSIQPKLNFEYFG